MVLFIEKKGGGGEGGGGRRNWYIFTSGSNYMSS